VKRAVLRTIFCAYCLILPYCAHNSFLRASLQTNFKECVSAEASPTSTQLQAAYQVAPCLVEEVPSISSTGDGLEIVSSVIVVHLLGS
jgi:hypothetical protein